MVSGRSGYTAILFDFEGTLVNFQWNLQAAVNEAREELSGLGFGSDVLAQTNYALIYNNALLAAPHVGLDPQEVASRIAAIYDRYDADALARWSLLPGVQDLLIDLKQRVALGLVTNVGRKAIEKALPKLELTALFDVVITRNEVFLLKPSGEGVSLALRCLGAQNRSTLFVGDSVADILAAREAAVPVAIILGGESDPAAIAAAGPTYLWRSLEEVRWLFPNKPTGTQF